MDYRVLHSYYRLYIGRSRRAGVLAAVALPGGYQSSSGTYSNASFWAATCNGTTRHHKRQPGVLAERLFQSGLGCRSAACGGSLWGCKGHYRKQAGGRKVEEKRRKISLPVREQSSSDVDL